MPSAAGNPLPAVIFMSIGALVAVALLGLLPAILAPPRAIPQPSRLSFETGVGDFMWQEHLCPCKNDWPLATDERNVSNAEFEFMGGATDPEGLSAMAPFWGQFIDHDVVLSKTNASDQTYSIQMYPYDATLTLTRVEHRLTGVEQCREAVTEITPTIDASTVYGDATLLPQLRDGTSCNLRTSAGNLLPLDTQVPNSFLAGDVRNTEHSILASLHTLWMREHNRLCDVLRAEEPFWNEELRFWKARQIVTAKIQHITYTEWLPQVFGSQAALLDTVPLRGTDTQIAMEFAVTAYRTGHSMVPDPIGPFTLPNLFFNRQLIIDDGIEPFLQATYLTPAQRADNMVVDGLRNFLFAMNATTIGEDLVARNVFRNRELGIGTYADVCTCYGLTPFPTATGTEAYVGLLQEPMVSGSSLPRTVAHIWAEQFRRLRERDLNFYDRNWKDVLGRRFFYEVNATRLSTVIALNSGLVGVPINVFKI